MFKALFTIIINMLATVLQLICWPLNQLIEATMPSIADKILEVTNGFNTLFDTISWGLGLIPQPIISVLTFILIIEIAKHTIYIGTSSLIKVWEVLQKIKFW